MSDDRVLQAALEDERSTEAEIERLRREIEVAEARLRTVREFVGTYRRYAGEAQERGAPFSPSLPPGTPGRVFGGPGAS